MAKSGEKRDATQSDAEAIVDAHIPGNTVTDTLFKQFLVNILEEKPDEIETLADYQIPHGDIKTAKVFHVLHWPTRGKGRPVAGPARFRFDAYTLKIVLSMFPNAQAEHFFHDYVCKSMNINGPDGKRLTNHQLYGDLPLALFVELTYNLICEADAAVAFVIHGGPVRRAIKERLGLEPDRPGAGQNYEIVDVLINGVERAFVFLPHGKYIGRWANASVRKKVSELLEETYIRFDVPIDVARLERRLQSRDELKHVTIPHSSAEELARDRQRKRRTTGLEAYPNESDESRAARHEKHKASRREYFQAQNEKSKRQPNESRAGYDKRIAPKRLHDRMNYQAKRAKREDETDAEFEKRLADVKAHQKAISDQSAALHTRNKRGVLTRRKYETDAEFEKRGVESNAKKAATQARSYATKKAKRPRRAVNTQVQGKDETDAEWAVREAEIREAKCAKEYDRANPKKLEETDGDFEKRRAEAKARRAVRKRRNGGTKKTTESGQQLLSNFVQTG